MIEFVSKATSWDETYRVPAITSLEAAIRSEIQGGAEDLQVFTQHSLNPCDEFPTPRPQYFVSVAPNGDLYLVNTEGYTYARYIVRIAQDPKVLKGADLAGACEGEQIADLIDLVREVASGGTASTSARAKALIAEITKRAKA